MFENMTTEIHDVRMPGYLAFCGVPDSIEALRLRWYRCYRPLLSDFLQQINHWQMTREEADEIVLRKVGYELHRCRATDHESFLEFCYINLMDAPIDLSRADELEGTYASHESAWDDR